MQPRKYYYNNMANVGGHLGHDKTWQKVSEHFYWKVPRTDVQENTMEEM